MSSSYDSSSSANSIATWSITRDSDDYVKYMKQNQMYTCGPVALMNVLLYLGAPIDHDDDYSDIVSECNCDENGTNDKDMTNTLENRLPEEWTFIKGKIGRISTLDKLVRRINGQKECACLLITFSVNNREGHFVVLLSSYDKDYYNCLNDGGQKLIKISKKYMKRSLKLGSFSYWLIKKRIKKRGRFCICK